MRGKTRRVRCRKSPPGWQDAFEKMVPIIESYARNAFRYLGAEAREEAVQEAICNACCAYARLAELEKTDIAYPTVLARFGIRQTTEGRKVGSQLNCRDVLSTYCRQKKNLVVERLDRYDSEEEAWESILVEDKHAGPAETAIIRIDFASWLELLPRRLRKIALFLAKGEATSAAAKRFHVSQGRISQMRRELHCAWHRFQDERGALAAAG